MSYYEILVIEPDKLVRESIVDLLSFENIPVFAIDDASLAIEFLQSNTVKLILLDYSIEKFQNSQSFLAKKALDHEICCIPVVIMSTTAQTLKKIKEPVLKKPFDVYEFLDYISKYCN